MSALNEVMLIDEMGQAMAELVCEHSPEAAIRAAAILYATMLEQFAQNPDESARQLADTREAVRRAMRARGPAAGPGDIAAELLLQ
jgi:hypothetical protein